MTTEEWDEYAREITQMYWEEEAEIEAGVHPTQIMKRAEEAIGHPIVDTFWNYIGDNIVKLHHIDRKTGKYNLNECYATFDYIKNEFI